MIPASLHTMLADLYDRLETLEGRIENRKRTGVLQDVDNTKRTARVVLGVDPKTGKEMLSPHVTWDEPAAGAMRVHTPRSNGEQVTIDSENGEFTDARITHAAPSDQNKAPNEDPEAHCRVIGNVKIIEKDGKVNVTVGGAVFEVTDDTVTLTAGTIKINGNIEHTGNMTTSGVHTDENGVHV